MESPNESAVLAGVFKICFALGLFAFFSSYFFTVDMAFQLWSVAVASSAAWWGWMRFLMMPGWVPVEILVISFVAKVLGLPKRSHSVLLGCALLTTAWLLGFSLLGVLAYAACGVLFIVAVDGFNNWVKRDSEYSKESFKDPGLLVLLIPLLPALVFGVVSLLIWPIKGVFAVGSLMGVVPVLTSLISTLFVVRMLSRIISKRPVATVDQRDGSRWIVSGRFYGYVRSFFMNLRRGLLTRRFVANALANAVVLGSGLALAAWIMGTVPTISLFAFIPNFYARFGLDVLVMNCVQVLDQREGDLYSYSEMSGAVVTGISGSGDPSLEGPLVYLLWTVPVSTWAALSLVTTLFVDKLWLRPAADRFVDATCRWVGVDVRSKRTEGPDEGIETPAL